MEKEELEKIIKEVIATNLKVEVAAQVREHPLWGTDQKIWRIYIYLGKGRMWHPDAQVISHIDIAVEPEYIHHQH